MFYTNAIFSKLYDKFYIAQKLGWSFFNVLPPKFFPLTTEKIWVILIILTGTPETVNVVIYIKNYYFYEKISYDIMHENKLNNTKYTLKESFNNT